MARPKKGGLSYFSFDTDFFYADTRIKRLRALYGNDALLMYIFLLTEIYRNGYYIEWDEDTKECIMADLSLTDGFIEQVMAYLFRRSLLIEISISRIEDEDSDVLPIPVKVITSPGIQKRYMEAVKSLKRDVYVSSEIWLLNKEDTATCIKFTQNYDKSGKNYDKSGKNYDKSGKNPTKEKKRKERKGNEIKENKTRERPPTACTSVMYFDDVELNALFVDFIKMRKTMKKPLTDLAITRAVNKIKRLSEIPLSDGDYDVELAKKIVAKTVDKSWTDFYEYKEDDNAKKKTNTQQKDLFAETIKGADGLSQWERMWKNF